MTRTISIKKYLRIGIFGGLFLFIILYTFFQTKAISRGVDLHIEGLVDGAALAEDIVSISGKATHATHLLINGKETVIDENDNFALELALSPGYNIITIEAEDRFEKKTKEVYRVLYEEKTPDVALESAASNL